MMKDSDLHTLMNLVDLHERASDVEVKAKLKVILMSLFDKINSVTTE